MRPAAKFHRVAIERFWLATNLHDAHGVAVFFAEELSDVLALLRFGIRNVRPRDLCILGDFVIHEFLHISLLFRRQRRATKIESQFLRPDVAPFLGCLA